MSIFRVNKTNNFTIVNNHVLRNKDASLKAKGLLVWMLSCDEDWNFSLEGMKKCLKEGEDSLRTGLKELEDLGYLNRIKLMPESYTNENGEKVIVRSQIEYIYNVYEQPTTNQDTEILHTENQYVESQSVENPVQRNTNNKEILKEEIPNIKEKPEEPPAIRTNNHSRNFRKDYEPLKDDLESGKDIDEQKKEKKKSPAEKERDACIREIHNRNFDEETKSLLEEYYNWASSGKDTRRVKSKNLWASKLNALEQVVKKTGQNAKDIVQQSIDNQWYKFVELEKIPQKQNSQNSYEGLQNSIPHQTQEESKAYLAKLLAEGAKVY